MKKLLALGAALSVVLLFASAPAEAQAKREVVNIKGACVYHSLLFCKSVNDGKGNIYDLSGLRRQPAVNQRIDLIGTTTGASGLCGKKLSPATAWAPAKGVHIPCFPLRPF